MPSTSLSQHITMAAHNTTQERASGEIEMGIGTQLVPSTSMTVRGNTVTGTGPRKDVLRVGVGVADLHRHAVNGGFHSHHPCMVRGPCISKLLRVGSSLRRGACRHALACTALLLYRNTRTNTRRNMHTRARTHTHTHTNTNHSATDNNEGSTWGALQGCPTTDTP